MDIDSIAVQRKQRYVEKSIRWRYKSYPLQQNRWRKEYTVSTYRIYKDNNGNVLKKEKVYVSYYPKKQGVVAVGTMEAPIVEEETTPVENIPSEDVVPPNNVEVNPEQETEAIFEESPISNN